MTKDKKVLASEYANNIWNINGKSLLLLNIKDRTRINNSKKDYLSGYEAAEKWISISETLPDKDEEVLVWVKYEGYEYFTHTLSEMDSYHPDSYIEPNSNKSWRMGSAKNFIITHWKPITSPI